MLLACLEEGFNCLPPAVFAQALERFLLTVGDKCEIAVFLLALTDRFFIENYSYLAAIMPDLQILCGLLLPGSGESSSTVVPASSCVFNS